MLPFVSTVKLVKELCEAIHFPELFIRGHLGMSKSQADLKVGDVNAMDEEENESGGSKCATHGRSP